jgi:hypothetical protein
MIVYVKMALGIGDYLQSYIDSIAPSSVCRLSGIIPYALDEDFPFAHIGEIRVGVIVW